MNTLRCQVLLLLACALGLTFALPAHAASEPRYQVEVLIFRHLDDSRTTPEAARVIGSEFDSRLEQQLAQIDAAPITRAAENDAGATPATTWQPVVGSTLILSKDADTLRRLSAYQVLAHLAWTQTAPDIAEAGSISLAELGLSPQDAFGSINFYSKRYLHLTVDVTLGAEPAPSLQILSNPFSFPQDGALTAQPAISDSRRIRLDQVTYFDQPQFGVVAVARRLD